MSTVSIRLSPTSENTVTNKCRQEKTVRGIRQVVKAMKCFTVSLFLLRIKPRRVTATVRIEGTQSSGYKGPRIK